MARYVVCRSHMKPSKAKKELPEIVYEYIANDSAIRWHYTFTRNIEKAYFFEDFELELAREIAWLFDMKVKELEV